MSQMVPDATHDLALLEAPTRQSPIAIWQMALVFLKNIGMVNLAIAGGFFLSGRMPVSVFIVLPLLAVAVLVANLVAWWRFTFRATADELVVTRGLVFQTSLTMPWSKVQSVSVNESLIQRLFGLVSASVDAAGSDGSEFEILGIRRDQAEALRRLASTVDDEVRTGPRPVVESGSQPILDPPVGSIVPGSMAPLPPPVLQPSAVAQQAADRSNRQVLAKRTPRELFILGALSNPLSGLAVIGAALYWFQDLGDRASGVADSVGVDVPDEVNITFSLKVVAAVAGFAILLFALTWLAVGIRTVVRNWGLQLSVDRDALNLDVGLFQRRSQSSNLNKVQMLVQRHGPLRRRFGFVRTELRTIGDGDLEILGLKPVEVGHVRSALGLAERNPPTNTISTHYVRQNARLIGLGFGLLLGLAIVLGVTVWPWLGVIFLAPVVVINAAVMFRVVTFQRNARWQICDELVRLSTGKLFVTESEMHRSKIQFVRVHQDWYQRRRDLAALHVGNAESTLIIPMLTLGDASHQRDVLLAPKGLANPSLLSTPPG